MRLTLSACACRVLPPPNRKCTLHDAKCKTCPHSTDVNLQSSVVLTFQIFWFDILYRQILHCIMPALYALLVLFFIFAMNVCCDLINANYIMSVISLISVGELKNHWEGSKASIPCQYISISNHYCVDNFYSLPKCGMLLTYQILACFCFFLKGTFFCSFLLVLFLMGVRVGVVTLNV